MNQIYDIAEKRIDLAQCEVLYRRPFTAESLKEDFEAASGNWSVDADGWLTGVHRDNSGGIVYSRQSWGCDMILEFDAQTIPPCCNDLNFVFKTEGWNYEKNDAGRGYITGLGGWWNDKAGMEKYPTCLPRALTPLYPLAEGHIYHIVAGSIQGHCFLFADGQLIIEMNDPSPEEFSDCGRFGFGTYASQVRFRDFTLYKAAFEPITMVYTPNF